MGVNHWYSQVRSTAKLSIPRKRHCYRATSKPWYSPQLHKIANAKDRLFRRSRGNPADSRIVLAYEKMRNWHVSELRLAELRHFRSIGHRLSTQPDSKSANWWSLMKSAAGWSSYQQIPPISDDSGLVHVSAKDRAEVLNAAFARQCSAPSAAHPPTLYFFCFFYLPANH